MIGRLGHLAVPAKEREVKRILIRKFVYALNAHDFLGHYSGGGCRV